MKNCYIDHPVVQLEISARSHMALCKKWRIIVDKYKVYEFRTGNNKEHEERLLFHTSSNDKLRMWMDLNNLEVSPSGIRRSDSGYCVVYVTLKEKE